MNPRLRSRWVALLAATMLGGVPGGVSVRASDSPFLQPVPSSQAPQPGDADLDVLQLTGLSVIGNEQLFNFVDPRTRKSFWVGLNGSENGFTVLSFDAENTQVVVQRGARQRTIGLRKPVITAVPVVPVTGPRPAVVPVAANSGAPVQPARPPGSGVDEIKNPQTPEQIKQAEFEARMLVSDLLDISMQERARQRALREAQARGAAPQPVNTAPAPQR